MKHSLILLLVMVLCLPHLNAQTQSNKLVGSTPVFRSYNSIHLLNGSSATSLALNSVNGFQFNKIFAGIGVGFDYYFQTTVPFFAEARYELISRKDKLQVFANGGVSFPFAVHNNKFGNNTGVYKTGKLYGGGIDYLLPIKAKAMILGIAFSHKQVIHMAENTVWNPMSGQGDNIPIKEDYSLNRIALRVGFGL